MRYYMGQEYGARPMVTGAGGENGGGPHAQDFSVENGGLSHRRASPKRQQMNEFRRVEKRRRTRRKMIRYLTVAGLTVVVGIRTYFFVSEGASGQDYIQVPPLTVVLESTEALGGSEKVTENAAPVYVPKDDAEAADALQLADSLQTGNWNGDALFAVIGENEVQEAYIGELAVAAYCGCQYCIGRSDTYVTWSGRLPIQGTTVAADLNEFEIGDMLRIGPDIYRVEDKVSPGAREALCLYFSNHADAISFGRQILPVFKIKSREEHLGEPLGIFEVTGYCGCEKCCGLKGGLTKAEKIPKAGHTIAADPEVLPMGSKVEINDIVYVVEDTGKLVKGTVIDIYFNTHEEAVRFGRQKINVYLVP